MKLNDGDVIEVNGKQGIVCFNATIDGNNYICLAFENNGQIYYEICDYKYEDEKLLVARLVDPKEINIATKAFFDKGMDEVGLPDDLTQLVEEKIRDLNNQ